MPDAPTNDWTPHLRRQLAGLRLDAAREAEVIEELSQHLDSRYDELRHSGAGEADARRLAMEEPPSRLALWSGRLALFAFTVALFAVIIVRGSLVEAVPAFVRP